MKDRIMQAAPLWKDNRSAGNSSYFLDPDQLELHVGTLETRVAAIRASPPPGCEIFV